VLLVSHDRRLLDNAVDGIVELERGTLTRYPGNWSKYLEQKELRFVSEQRVWEEQQDFIRKEEAFIRKHLGSQRTAEAKGRERKLQNIVRVEKPFHDVRRPAIRAPQAERGGELVVEARDLAVGYDRAKPVFIGAEVRIARGDRIGIVGGNGAGKTTLLKVLAGKLDPLSGSFVRGHRAACGYFDQDTSELRNDGTPYTEIRRSHPQMTDQEIRDHLAKFLFRGNDIDASVSSLSGGERARLCLSRLVLSKPSWLAMDEPTNHLDLAARTALEEMLGDFEGAMVFVSHDRAFLDGLCTRILEVGGGTVRRFDGNYSAWRAKKRASESVRKPAPAPPPKKEKAKEPEKPKPPPKPAAKSSPGKVRNPYLFEKLEKKIMELEEEMKALAAATATEEVYRDPKKLRDTQMRMAEIERDLAHANEEWANWQ
jgi:ATP-binding cassette subfamily F protein 3